MELHDAIKKARKELGMSQQRLAELAGIERKQLSTLEGGGNVTLATIKKIVPHLPNLQTFTLGGAPGRTQPQAPAGQVEVVAAAGQALAAALQSLHTIVGALTEVRVPDEREAQPLTDAGRALYRSMGRTEEEYDAMVAQIATELPPQEPMTEEAAQAALAELAKVAAEINLDDLDEELDEKP